MGWCATGWNYPAENRLYNTMKVTKMSERSPVTNEQRDEWRAREAIARKMTQILMGRVSTEQVYQYMDIEHKIRSLRDEQYELISKAISTSVGY